MNEKKKPPPPPGYSAFRELLGKVAKVPKAEVDEEERKFKQRLPPAMRPGRKKRAS